MNKTEADQKQQGGKKPSDRREREREREEKRKNKSKERKAKENKKEPRKKDDKRKGGAPAPAGGMYYIIYCCHLNLNKYINFIVHLQNRVAPLILARRGRRRHVAGQGHRVRHRLRKAQWEFHRVTPYHQAHQADQAHQARLAQHRPARQDRAQLNRAHRAHRAHQAHQAHLAQQRRAQQDQAQPDQGLQDRVHIHRPHHRKPTNDTQWEERVLVEEEYRHVVRNADHRQKYAVR